MEKKVKVGLVGAGYISAWHAKSLLSVPNVDLAAVCDVSESAAESLAGAFGIRAFSSIEELIESKSCDAVHILTPPHHHKALALQCLNAGLDVLVEKPAAESVEDVFTIKTAAERAGCKFFTSHNFLGLPSYQRLKAELARGTYGRISSAEFVWNFPFSPLRSGPFNLWPLQEPKNLLLELGPHLFAFSVDLFGAMEILHVETSKEIRLPSGEIRPQCFRILARASNVDLSFMISTVETIDDRSFVLRGSSARARLVISDDILLVERDNTSDIVVNPLRRRLAIARQHVLQGVSNAFVQGYTLNSGNPYGRSFRGMMSAIYSGAAESYAADKSLLVMSALEDSASRIPSGDSGVPSPRKMNSDINPSVAVIGGTGFIGRALTRMLVEKGHKVRVLSRASKGPFEDISRYVETVSVSLHDRSGLNEALEGIDTVYNLAKYTGNSWNDCLKNDVGTTMNVAEACLSADVKRLIYTGTISSYDMTNATQTITEETEFPADMTSRSLYGRSKAECERQLMKMHWERNLPLIVARPGIVIGQGGPLQHWGIGRWHGAGSVRLWGNGRNILPFVLINDVADALVRMSEVEGIVGESFNLIGDPMLSANDYFDAIHSILGARIQVSSGNLYAFYLMDTLKFRLKKHFLSRRDIIQPSLADWRSRGHFSKFSNKKSKECLGWAPEANPENFLNEAIAEANIFGF